MSHEKRRRVARRQTRGPRNREFCHRAETNDLFFGAIGSASSTVFLRDSSPPPTVEDAQLDERVLRSPPWR
jgi:hypothetical protein